MGQWWTGPAIMVGAVIVIALIINIVMPAPEIVMPATEHYPPYARLNYGTHPGAPVTLVEFVDLQCPFCASMHPVLSRLREEFGEELNYVIKHAPNAQGHPQAVLAAMAAECAHKQGARDAFIQAAFDRQVDLSINVLSAIASELTLDRQEFDQCVRTQATKELIESDLLEAAKVNLRGTPTIFINGARLEGIQQESHIHQISEAIIDESKKTK